MLGYFENIDTNSRSYYRRQFNLINKVSKRCDKAHLTDEWFEKNCLDINLLKCQVKRVERNEESAKRGKNKKFVTKINNSKDKSRKKEKKNSLKLSA